MYYASCESGKGARQIVLMLLLVIAAGHLDVTSGQAAVEAGLRFAGICAEHIGSWTGSLRDTRRTRLVIVDLRFRLNAEWDRGAGSAKPGVNSMYTKLALRARL
jgi:hypothetical protein